MDAPGGVRDDAGPAARPADRDELAMRLRCAQRAISSADLDDGARQRLHRRLAAIGDATKVRGVNPARVTARIERLLAELDKAQDRNF